MVRDPGGDRGDGKDQDSQESSGSDVAGGIIYTADLEEAMKDKNLLVMAVPSVFVRSTAQKMKPFCKEGQLIVDVAKGIEENTLKDNDPDHPGRTSDGGNSCSFRTEPRGGGKPRTSDALLRDPARRTLQSTSSPHLSARCSVYTRARMSWGSRQAPR